MVEDLKKVRYIIDWDILFQIFALILGLIPTYFLFKTSPQEITIQAMILFGIYGGSDHPDSCIYVYLFSL